MHPPRILLAALVACAVISMAYAQESIPVLRSTSPTLQVREGNRLILTPFVADLTVPITLHVPRHSDHPLAVTFVSDLDSLAIPIAPGGSRDFLLALEDGAVARIRVLAMRQSPKRSPPAPAEGPVSIPFTLRNGRMILTGSINGSPPLDLIFDTGLQGIALLPRGKRKGVSARFLGQTVMYTADGPRPVKISIDNRVEIAGLRWDNEFMSEIALDEPDCDAAIGYSLFENKVVELDFDRMLITSHDSLPANVAEFASTRLSTSGPHSELELALDSGTGQAQSGWFWFDTGAAEPLRLLRGYSGANDLRRTLRPIARAERVNAMGERAEVDRMILPALTLAGYTLRDVPIEVDRPGPIRGHPDLSGVLGLEGISRFNAYLDYVNDVAYFKPNSRAALAFPNPPPSSSATMPVALIAIGIVLVVIVAAVAFVLRSKPPEPSA